MSEVARGTREGTYGFAGGRGVLVVVVMGVAVVLGSGLLINGLAICVEVGGPCVVGVVGVEVHVVVAVIDDAKGRGGMGGRGGGHGGWWWWDSKWC